MNTGADVSYLLKARQALKDSEDAERRGDRGDAIEEANLSIAMLTAWIESMMEKEAA